jgi:tetratricopeptide (TPR) repeat protein
VRSLEVGMIPRPLLALLLLLPSMLLAGEAAVPVTEPKVFHLGRWVTQEEKAKLDQGLVLYRGKWMPEAEMYQAKGYVKHLGTWISPSRLKAIQKRQQQARERIKFASDWANAWVYKTEPGHFVIKSNVSPELVKDIGLAMEQCYNELARVFGAKTNIKAISVEVFATQDQFIRESAKAGFPMSRNVLGYFYWGSSTGIRTFYAGTPEQTMSTLFHECTHLVINQVCDEVPTWANEGLAVFFESALRDDKGMTLETIPFGRLWHLKTMLKRGELSLNRLCQLQGMGQYTGEFYPQGWALIHFLLYADKGKHRRSFESFYGALTKKNWDGDSMAIFKKHFGREPEDFYPDWKAYVLGIEPRTAQEFVAAATAAYTDWLDFESAQEFAAKALELGKGKDEEAVLLCNARLHLTLGRWVGEPERKAEHFAKAVEFFEKVFPPASDDPKAKKPSKSRKITPAYATDRLDFARACIGAGRYEQAQDLIEDVLSKKEFEFNAEGYSVLAHLYIAAEDPAFRSLELAKENATLAEDLGADQENKYVQALIALADNDKATAAKLLNDAAVRDEFGFGGQFFRRELARLTGVGRRVVVEEAGETPEKPKDQEKGKAERGR